MPTIQAVIFDLDDTLYSERTYAFSGFAAVAAAFKGYLGDPVQTEAHLRSLFDTEHRRRVFDTLLDQRGFPPDEALVARMIETYHTHRPMISLHPDADRVLAHLHGRHKLGLLTDGLPAAQWAKIEALGLRDRMDHIIVTSDLGLEYTKPHTRAFELTSAQFGVDAARCAYAADNPAKDFLGPNTLGWLTVQVVRADGIYRSEPPAPGGRPEHVIDNLDRLPNLLE
jgi:putative hydrolase of the HAD superfamily